ncbi:unnamed protein product [Gordionus sp. m RMFG-2023]
MKITSDVNNEDIQKLKDVANKLRIHSIEETNASNSGHPTSCCSCAEVMSVLFFNEMRYKPENPQDPANDRFVLSKGHAAPILYACWAEAGFIPLAHLLTLRKFDSNLQGHPTAELPFIDVATGSLGQGLSFCCGMAYTAKYLENGKVYCLMGDGEFAEGSVFEAMSFASFYELDNLVAIIDVNRLGQSGETMLEKENKSDFYAKRAEAFGFQAETIDGNSVEALIGAFTNARNCKKKPYCIVAQTLKGKGIPGIEGQSNWHGKPLGDKAADAIKAIKSHIVNQNLGVPPLKIKSPEFQLAPNQLEKIHINLSQFPKYKIGEKIATRAAYGDGLVSLADNCPLIVGMDGDVKNSTFSIKLMEKHPDRFIECYIAEQLLVGVAIGCGARSRTIPFASTFACFLTRAFDQIRMAALSQANIKLCGSHCGCSIGEDGPSQMALEDIAMFRSIPKCLIIYPSDAVATEKGMELMANYKGISYIRTSRPTTSVIYSPEEVFEIGKCKVVKEGVKDKITIVGGGITLFEALAAGKELSNKGIDACIIDIFSIKPIDAKTIRDHAVRTGGILLTVEDHYLEGGMGEAINSALSEQKDVKIKNLYVTGLPRSGLPEQLMEHFGISKNCIVKAALALLQH